MRSLDELLLGGPGHNCYIYNAEIICVNCGQETIRELYEKDPSAFDVDDSDSQPIPIFDGESDQPEHCAECGEYMYGDQPPEPQEDDYVTTDHKNFYQYGKLVVQVPMLNEFDVDNWHPYVKAHMDENEFWTNVWFISDHGNAHLLEI